MPMTAPKSGAKVRMYRHGHGDCFLLAFPRSGANSERPVYVLIDCGYKPGSCPFPIEQLVPDIVEATNGHIDLAIITHEHQDHVNGIWSKNSPPFKDIKIDAAWFAWTESPDDELAIELRRRHKDKLLGLIGARRGMAAAFGAGGAHTSRIDALLSLELGLDADELPSDAIFAAKAKDPTKSVNKQGMKLIKDKAGENVKYIRPHDGVLKIKGVEGLRVYALGPPYDADLLSDENPKGDEAFPGHHLGVGVAGSFSHAALGEATSPFPQHFAIPAASAFDNSPAGQFFARHYGQAQPAAAPTPPARASRSRQAPEAADDAPWRRIDGDWLWPAEELALALNRGVNNTSLVLAFELPNTGKVLLFVGDAQRGNWVSWAGKGKTWTVGGKKITARDLLARTVLYKVGHHGSHNATLNGTDDDDQPPNLSWMAKGEFADEFTAMITAVPDWAYALKEEWAHPLQSIKTALMTKTQGRVFQTARDTTGNLEDDTDEPRKPPHVSKAAWKEFTDRVKIDPDGKWYEYTISD